MDQDIDDQFDALNHSIIARIDRQKQFKKFAKEEIAKMIEKMKEHEKYTRNTNGVIITTKELQTISDRILSLAKMMEKDYFQGGPLAVGGRRKNSRHSRRRTSK